MAIRRRTGEPAPTSVDPAVGDQCLLLVQAGRSIRSVAKDLGVSWDVMNYALTHAKLRQLVSGSPAPLPWSSVLAKQAAWKRSR